MVYFPFRTELKSGEKAEIVVTPSYGLDDAQVEAMLQASLDYAEEDVYARMLKTAVVEGERVLHALDVAKSKDGDLLTDEEKAIIDVVVTELKAAMAGTDHNIVQDLTETLEKVTAGFAHRRMDRAMSAGFKDMEVDELERVITSDEDADKKPSEDV